MLTLKNIVKTYDAGDTKVQALKGVSVSFRESEFVAILGQSGCGKTTMLNIIGGLDKYTSGDLIINGVSTKKYKDRDWDTYRNHSIGFVFQSYNLIPHQTVLSNVELALTLSGVSKAERRRRAKEAIEKVGLGDQLKKKPNQMSGGQMQRIAIARALVNDPDILLADEPTGALDSETSVQVMEILKEISKDRLIIMVTHNPELAKAYSTRIISLLDGNITSDTDPYYPDNETVTAEASKAKQTENKEPEDMGVSVFMPKQGVYTEAVKPSKEEEKSAKNNSKNSAKASSKGRKKHTSMSFFTAVGLSLNNLMTKKARTFLTAFAGSIGIIGIALITSLSNGFQSYIDKVEQDTLSAYPLTIESTALDYASILSTMTKSDGAVENEEGVIYSNDVMTGMMSSALSGVRNNDLYAFKKYIEDESNGFQQYISATQYQYGIDLLSFAYDASGALVTVNPSILNGKFGGGMGMASAMSMGYDVWTELLDGEKLLDTMYDVVDGRFPDNYKEVVVIVDDHYRIADTTLYTLGIRPQSEIDEILMKMYRGEEFETSSTTYSYEDLIGREFYVVAPTELYRKNAETGIYSKLESKDEDYEEAVTSGIKVKVVGIIMPSKDASNQSTAGGIGYTSALTKKLIEQVKDSAIYKDQLANEEIDVLTGKPFEMGFGAKNNYTKFGVVDLDHPKTINLYAADFEAKEKMTELIDEYNKKMEEEDNEDGKITYTDLVGLMMSSVSTVINAISYVLIAFVSISLVVSSIMIGIITYISVLERTKEIGVLRSIGASKRDVKRVFNAETLIIGFVSGGLGILITLLLDIPANIIIKKLSGISNVAVLPVNAAVILILISVFLTMIAGLIPAGVAAKKDPVIALRSE